MDQVNQYIDVFSAVIGFVLGCGVTISVQRLRQGRNANYSNQQNSRAGGDQAGRDIKK